MEGTTYQENPGVWGFQIVLVNSWLEGTLNITWFWFYFAAPIVNLKPSFSNYDLGFRVLEGVMPQDPMARVGQTTGLRSTNPMYGREDAR